MPKNKLVSDYLKTRGWTSINANKIVADLIEGKFVEAEPMTEPERIAEAAKGWLGNVGGPKQIFDFASGWTTASWEHILEETIDHDLQKQKNVFAALVILAKEAGMDL